MKNNLLIIFLSTLFIALLLFLLFKKAPSTKNTPISEQQEHIEEDTINLRVDYTKDNQGVRGLLLKALDSAKAPTSWPVINRKDLNISLRLPPGYKVESPKSYTLYLDKNIVGALTVEDSFSWRFKDDPEKIPLIFSPSGHKIYIGIDPYRGKEYILAAIELSYLSTYKYLFFELPKQDIETAALIISGISGTAPDPKFFKSYTNTDLGFRIKFPINKNGKYALSEYFEPGPKGSFSVYIEGGVGLRTAGKDYICECDAGPKSLNTKFPKNIPGSYYPIEYFKNKQGIEYAVMHGVGRVEDDVLGENIHEGEKIYVIKTNDSDFAVINIVTSNSFQEEFAKFIIESFEWLQ